MKCYRRYNKKMAELLSHVRPWAFTNKHLILTTTTTSSTDEKNSNSIYAQYKHKKNSNYIPNPHTAADDKPRKNVGTNRDKEWQAPTRACQFGYQYLNFSNTTTILGTNDG